MYFLKISTNKFTLNMVFCFGSYLNRIEERNISSTVIDQNISSIDGSAESFDINSTYISTDNINTDCLTVDNINLQFTPLITVTPKIDATLVDYQQSMSLEYPNIHTKPLMSPTTKQCTMILLDETIRQPASKMHNPNDEANKQSITKRKKSLDQEQLQDAIKTSKNCIYPYTESSSYLISETLVHLEGYPITNTPIATQSTQTEKNASMITEFLTNVLYYRYNIGYTLTYYFKKRTGYDSVDKATKNNTFSTNFINTCLQFVQTCNTPRLMFKNPVCNTEVYKDLLDNENLIKNESLSGKNKEDDCVLSAAQNIKQYNKLVENLFDSHVSQTEFMNFKIILKYLISSSFNAVKYYDMFLSVLVPMYKLSKYLDNYLNEKIQKNLSKTLSDDAFFVDYRKKQKEHYFFFWCFNWGFLFSKHKIIPEFTNEKADFFIIKSYPIEFFIQLIILIHICYNAPHYNTFYENKGFVHNWKLNILFLLQKQQVNGELTYLQKTVKELLFDIKEIYNSRIVTCPSIWKLRIIQTSQQNLTLSEKITPILTNYLNKATFIAEKSFKQTTKNK